MLLYDGDPLRDVQAVEASRGLGLRAAGGGVVRRVREMKCGAAPDIMHDMTYDVTLSSTTHTNIAPEMRAMLVCRLLLYGI